jgi:hypothetical protein
MGAQRTSTAFSATSEPEIQYFCRECHKPVERTSMGMVARHLTESACRGVGTPAYCNDPVKDQMAIDTYIAVGGAAR